MRVLILTASYGSGHNEAARGLAAAVERHGARALVVDQFRELVDSRFEGLTRRLYCWLLRRAPAAWALAYQVGDRLASDSPLTFGATRVGAARLARLLETLAPDAVVTVHATPAVTRAWLAGTGHRVPPHTTVVTDFVAHRQWLAPAIERYCVAAPEVKHELIARGIAAERIVVTGVPVRAEFDEPLTAQDARARLGLDPRSPVVLAMAGSDPGLGRLPEIARALMRLERPVQGIVLAGRDRALGDRLRAMTAGAAIRVLGYTTDVRTLMAAADLLVTKAGGMTIAEAIAAELPVLLHGSLPGQERRNERFAPRAGFALVARSSRDLARALDRALGDRSLREHLRERIRDVRQPAAASRIASLVLEGASHVPDAIAGDGSKGPAA